MSVRRIIESFESWRAFREPMVLATVFDTLGSTYSKAGHRILIAANGDYQGLVSGGCLEGDLAERARAVVEARAPSAVTYDMRDDADDLWGLGIGCNGLIRVFLQPMDAEGGYEPFASIAERLVGTRRAAAATVISSARTDLQAGDTWLLDGPTDEARLVAALSAPASWLAENAADALAAGCRRAIETGRARYSAGLGQAREGAPGKADDAVRIDGVDVLFAPLEPVPRVLVLGAGLDAIPIVNLAADLGWFVTVADHRPAYLERGVFARADRVLPVEPAALRAEIPVDEFDAILVMSHHLATDRVYLSQLADARARYLGVLGPPARRARLLDALGDAGAALRPRLRGPVGIDIGADSPESIALSVVAELQSVFAASRDAATAAAQKKLY